MYEKNTNSGNIHRTEEDGGLMNRDYQEIKEVAQQLRALSGHAEDLDSVFHTHLTTHNLL